MEEWICKYKLDFVNVSEKHTLINNLKTEIKDNRKKKKDAYRNGHMGLLDYLQRTEDSLYDEIYKHDEELVRHILPTLKYNTYIHKLEVDYHSLRVNEACILGDMLLIDVPKGVKWMTWVTGVGAHSKNNYCILKARLKDVLAYYEIKYEEGSDRLTFALLEKV